MLFSSEQNPFDLIAPDINVSPIGSEAYQNNNNNNNNNSLNSSGHNQLDLGTGPKSIDADDLFDPWLWGIDDHNSWKTKKEKHDDGGNGDGDGDNTGGIGGGGRGGYRGQVNGELVLQMIVEMEQMILRANALPSPSPPSSSSSSSSLINNNMSSSALTLAGSERAVSLSVDAAIARWPPCRSLTYIPSLYITHSKITHFFHTSPLCNNRVVAHMNNRTINRTGNNNHSNNNDTKGVSGGNISNLFPLPPTPPSTSEASPLDYRERQGQGLGSGTIPPGGVITDDEGTVVVPDLDPATATMINGSSNGATSDDLPSDTLAEDRCVFAYTLSTHTINALYQSILPTHPINAPY